MVLLPVPATSANTEASFLIKLISILFLDVHIHTFEEGHSVICKLECVQHLIFYSFREIMIVRMTNFKQRIINS
jgi:hypothetical protein